MNPHRAIGFYHKRSTGYDADLLTYISGLSTELSTAQLGYINTFISDYKTHDSLTNLSDKYDVMYYLGNETVESSLRNMVKRSHDATAVNGIEATHVPYEGFTGDGISMYIDSNYYPDTEGETFSLNNASFGLYFRKTVDDGLTKINGAWHTTSPAFRRIQLTLTSGGINGGISIAGTIIPPNGGFKIVTRLASNAHSIYLNKVQENFGIASIVIPDRKVYINRLNYGTAFCDTAQFSFAFLGAGLTQTSVNYITDDFEALMDSNGKGVI